jgi:RNA polymerase sigma-70 factor (ECF subfamily)
MTLERQETVISGSLDANERFLTLFLSSQTELRAYVSALVRSRSDVDDILQETLLTLWAKFSEYDPTRSFASWARGIAANKVLRWRHRTNRLAVLSPEAIQVMADTFDRLPSPNSRTAEALDECLKLQPPASQQLLIRRYLEHWTIDRIAEKLGGTEAAVHKQLQRLRERLLNCIARRLHVSSELK